MKKKEITMAENPQTLNGRDGANYTRVQKGHSAIIGWLIIGPLTGFIVPIYWTISKNHYWHL